MNMIWSQIKLDHPTFYFHAIKTILHENPYRPEGRTESSQFRRWAGPDTNRSRNVNLCKQNLRAHLVLKTRKNENAFEQASVVAVWLRFSFLILDWISCQTKLCHIHSDLLFNCLTGHRGPTSISVTIRYPRPYKCNRSHHTTLPVRGPSIRRTAENTTAILQSYSTVFIPILHVSRAIKLYRNTSGEPAVAFDSIMPQYVHQ